jgi:stearoyl-CoA desaturase (delta-9 desaturase)
MNPALSGSPSLRPAPTRAARAERKLDWFKSIPMISVHVAALGVLCFPFAWKWVALCVASYYLRMFAITGGYHRYFSHRTYKTSRLGQFALAFLGGCSTQKGALWWAANHRFHHKHSDEEIDLHSPIRHGFWWAHVGWILSPSHEETLWEQIPDLAKYPELRFLNHFHLLPPVLYGAGIFAAFGWAGFFWGFVLSTVLLWHGTFTINSLSHVFGRVRYQTTDTSKNNFWLALLTLGEGWHNNHHAYMSSTNNGFFWWEVDPTYYTIKALSWVKLTSGIRKPPLALLEARRLRRAS